MKSMRFFYIFATIAMISILFGCNSKSNNPQAPTDPNRNVLLTENFETDLLKYQQVTYMPGWGMMSISAQAAHSGTHSLTSDANLTGIKKRLDAEIQDSIAGLEFYIMAKKGEQINLFAALCQSGSSFNGLFTIMGMGISKSDSLYFVYENTPTDSATMKHQNFAALQFNKWYKCNIEYDFNTSILNYYLDGAVVGTLTVPQAGTLPLFVVLREDLISQGAKEYYIDDVTIYKK